MDLLEIPDGELWKFSSESTKPFYAFRSNGCYFSFDNEQEARRKFAEIFQASVADIKLATNI